MRSTPGYSLLRIGVVPVALLTVLICTAFSAPPSSKSSYSRRLQVPLMVQSGSGAEYARTYASDCATPQTDFYFGDTVCVESGGFPFTSLD